MAVQQDPVRVISQSLDQSGLRLSARIRNISVRPVPAAVITALLYDANGNLVNASQTTVSELLPEGEKDIVFTWQEPFSEPVVRAEITPRVQ
ncbi:MAG: hypothetical protein JO026_00500 [Patescibacteria group bacterium]|nr:hypothetical protein [Patescibacteria group bacterium]